MREATTNVLRHSRAGRAEVDYRIAGGFARLRVSNDGAEEHPAALEGTGLRALAERLEAAGGELTWNHDGDRFEVAASLPANPPGSTRSTGSTGPAGLTEPMGPTQSQKSPQSPNPADGAAR
jgi:two-component system sensor histidine kinase DesK